MTSDSDPESGKKQAEERRGQVVTNGLGHQVWEGTVRTVKLSLMKTGLFYKSEKQQRLLELREGEGLSLESDPEKEDGGGFDPYNSSR